MMSNKIIYNNGRTSSYIIFDDSLKSDIREVIQPSCRVSFSRIVYEKFTSMYFHGSLPLLNHYNHFKQKLDFTKYIKEVLLIDDQYRIDWINENKKYIRVKKLKNHDSIAIYNFVTFFIEYDDSNEKLIDILGEFK